MSQQWSHKRLIKGSRMMGLSTLVLPLALLGGCAGSSEESSYSAGAATPEKAPYLTDVLEPGEGNASSGYQKDSPDSIRQQKTVPAEESAAVNRDSKEEEAMTVMVLEALNGHPPVVMAPSHDVPQAQEAVQVPPEPRQLRFAFDTSELSARDQALLSAHARFLKASPDYRLKISGHTDASGPEGYNRRLSYRRAQSVALYLQGKGVNPQQLEVTGLGSDRPLAGVDAPRQRRVELDYQSPQLLSHQSGGETRQ